MVLTMMMPSAWDREGVAEAVGAREIGCDAVRCGVDGMVGGAVGRRSK